MKFSVLISVYYKEKPEFLRGSLKSIIKQTLLPDEIVLVEDGQLTQPLYEVINDFKQEFKCTKVVCLKENAGLGVALNEGLKHCTYDVVARMDSDDECYPIRFEKQINYLKENPDIDVVGSLTTEFCSNNEGDKIIMSLKHFPETVEENNKYSRKRCPVEHPAVIFRKKAVQEAGGYIHCPLFEDYHLWARMIMNGSKFYNIQEPLLYFRMSDESYIRRGGLKYAITEYKSLRKFRQIGFLNCYQFIFSVITRFPIRIMPTVLRRIIYKNLLRSKSI